jgi:hypothetical protein
VPFLISHKSDMFTNHFSLLVKDLLFLTQYGSFKESSMRSSQGWCTARGLGTAAYGCAKPGEVPFAFERAGAGVFAGSWRDLARSAVVATFDRIRLVEVRVPGLGRGRTLR